MTRKRRIGRADIMSMAEYAKERRERLRRMAAAKKARRIEVGPFATFSFESYDTMWHQVHEMLYIERGGEAQVADELEAYNPLIPQGRELVATLMFEIADPARRERVLSRLGGVEERVRIEIDGEEIGAVPADEVARSTPEGRTSSVHFLRFPFTPGQIARFRDPRVRAVIAIDHPGYQHMAVIPEPVRRTLAEDFD